MKVAIIGAMEEEVEVLRGQIENQESTVIATQEYTTGTLEGVDIILLKSGIGKVNAAMSTAILLEKFQPDYVINTGSAGGFAKNLEVGDVVVSTEVAHHDVDVTAFGYKYGQVPRMDARFQADEKLVTLAMEVCKDENIGVGKGLIVTGDTFMNDPKKVDFVQSHFPDMQAMEMEAAAVAQVCTLFNVPFVVIRALSDIVGKESNITFDQFLPKAVESSSRIVKKFVKALQ